MGRSTTKPVTVTLSGWGRSEAGQVARLFAEHYGVDVKRDELRDFFLTASIDTESESNAKILGLTERITKPKARDQIMNGLAALGGGDRPNTGLLLAQSCMERPDNLIDLMRLGPSAPEVDYEHH